LSREPLSREPPGRDPAAQREYFGVDLSERRIEAAKLTARRLGLDNIHFEVGDARTLRVERSYDAALMVDLVHHLPLDSRQPLFDQLMGHLGPSGRLVVKDIVPRPKWKLFWTWALDVAMTRGTEMWYWDESQFRGAATAAVGEGALTVETYEISDWLPYPHIAYVFERRS
jgi:SAM-dependent methyltransferase